MLGFLSHEGIEAIAESVCHCLRFDFFKSWEQIAASVNDTFDPDSILTNPK